MYLFEPKLWISSEGNQTTKFLCCCICCIITIHDAAKQVTTVQLCGEIFSRFCGNQGGYFSQEGRQFQLFFGDKTGHFFKEIWGHNWPFSSWQNR